MAIENTYLLGKNITLGCGFDLQAKAPLDSRQVVPAFEGLRALIIGDAAYEGMIVYDEGTKKTYQAQKCESYSVEVDGKTKTYDIAFREFGLTDDELKTLIASETTAAMEFKGATATLPTDPTKGDMWKVTASFEVAGETTKVGDSIVYNGEEWFRIPSGDDIEDTWRPVTDVNNDATLTFAAGNKLDVAVNANGTITYNHEAIDAPELLAENEQTRTYITEVETDGFGHITGYKTATENVVDTNTTYEFVGLPVGEDEEAPSNVYFQVQASDAEAAEVIYLDAYTRNEADGKFVAKDGDKQLSDNNFTDELLAKLNGIEAEANKYEHAEHTAYAEGLYKVTVDAEGHVSNATAVTKQDIVDLGIPGQDTTYEKANADADGLMSKEHFSKVEDIEAGAQVNVIESIKVNGEALEITDKAVGIILGDLASKDEIAKADLAEALATELDAKVASVTAGDASITIDGEAATTPTVAVKISAVEGNAIKLAEDGLKVIIPESTKVEASETNGNIKVDGDEVTVYSHPESHTVSEISDFYDCAANKEYFDFEAENKRAVIKTGDLGLYTSLSDSELHANGDANGYTIRSSGTDSVVALHIDGSGDGLTYSYKPNGPDGELVTKRVLFTNEVGRSDYAENDPTKVSYISNRPFYASDLKEYSAPDKSATGLGWYFTYPNETTFDAVKASLIECELPAASEILDGSVTIKDIDGSSGTEVATVYTKPLSELTRTDVTGGYKFGNYVFVITDYAAFNDAYIGAGAVGLDSNGVYLLKCEKDRDGYTDTYEATSISFAYVKKLDNKFLDLANNDDFKAQAQAIENETARATGAEETLDGRIQALEAIDHEAYVAADEAVLEAAKLDASNKDIVVLSEAQKYTDALAGNVYSKEQTYTQDEVDALISAATSWGEF